MKGLKSFLITLALFLAVMARIDRFCLKKNGGFSIAHITAALPAPPLCSSGLSRPDMALFVQPFYYLTKGHQSYVFVSRDGKTVLKFYRFPSHLRKHSSFLHALAYGWKPKRKHIQAYNLKKLETSFSSYHLALEELSEETGTLYVHLAPTTHLREKVILVDRLRRPYFIDLDTSYFVIQKRGNLIFPLLEECLQQKATERAEQILKSIIQTIVSRCQKGIADHDAILEKNYGLLDDRAIHIDIGRFEKVPFPLNSYQECVKITEPLANWLQERSPELFEKFHALLEDITTAE